MDFIQFERSFEIGIDMKWFVVVSYFYLIQEFKKAHPKVISEDNRDYLPTRQSASS